MSDLFQRPQASDSSYSAKDIEVLEGLEAVRRRPGMYIGGTGEHALHHLAAEVLDNAMDEAVAGHASRIDVRLLAGNWVEIRDNGRGIPIDPHPKYPDRSALEVIFTMLHSGGKFSGEAYKTSGGLHGVGVSVVNALTDELIVEVARDRRLWTQTYSRGIAITPLKDLGAVQNRRGTAIRFHPDAGIFGIDNHYCPRLLYHMARSKAYLYRGVEIRWFCDPAHPCPNDIPREENLHFPDGLADYLASALDGRATLTLQPFVGEAAFASGEGRIEWAIAWPQDDDGFISSYCNTVPTPQGGAHESGLRTALVRGVKSLGERLKDKRAAAIAVEDVMNGACVLLSVFIREPQFQGQTKEKLVTAEAARLVESAIKDHFDHFLSDDPTSARALLDRLIERAEDRLKRREKKELDRKSATRRLRLPGKLTDCSRSAAAGTEIFLVEGDSAGGSAKQARNRETQAVLPLRGKILNVASASSEKLRANQELQDLVLALGSGIGERYDDSKLRYERVIIMTDADVDGAHIAALLMTFFFREMPRMIENGHLFLAQPPLYRISQAGRMVYARDDGERERIVAEWSSGRGKIEVSRFKGLGEMPSAQLKETTMDPAKRMLLKVSLPPAASDPRKTTNRLVESLMGRKPELRFAFIQENARFVRDLDI